VRELLEDLGSSRHIFPNVRVFFSLNVYDNVITTHTNTITITTGIGWKPYNCNRVILLVRNPFDAIDSHFNMALTRTHNRSLDETEYVRLKDRWEEFVLAEMDVWCRFHRYWILKAIKSKVPLLVLRFEDVVRDKTLNLRRTLGFLCEGTTTRSDDFLASCEKRLELSTRSKGGGAGYKPRSSGGPGKSLVHYDEKLCQRIQDKIPNILISLRAFGYENLLCGKRDVIDRVDLSPNNLMEALKISKDATTTMSPCEGESKRRKQMWRKGSRGSFPSRPSIGVNESSELIRPQTKSDVSRRGIQWSRHLHRAGIRFKGAKEITPVL